MSNFILAYLPTKVKFDMVYNTPCPLSGAKFGPDRSVKKFGTRAPKQNKKLVGFAFYQRFILQYEPVFPCPLSPCCPSLSSSCPSSIFLPFSSLYFFFSALPLPFPVFAFLPSPPKNLKFAVCGYLARFAATRRRTRFLLSEFAFIVF